MSHKHIDEAERLGVDEIVDIELSPRNPAAQPEAPVPIASKHETAIPEPVTSISQEPPSLPAAPPQRPAKPESPDTTHAPRHSWKRWFILAVIALIVLTAHLIWTNVNVASGKLQGNTTVMNENTITPPDVLVNVTSTTANNLTIINQINATFTLPPEVSNALIAALNRTGGNSS